MVKQHAESRGSACSSGSHVHFDAHQNLWVTVVLGHPRDDGDQFDQGGAACKPLSRSVVSVGKAFCCDVEKLLALSSLFV